MSARQWEEYLQFYHEQNQLEEYQKKRELPRPKTTKMTVVLYIVILLIVVLGLGVGLFFISSLEMWVNILAFLMSIFCLIEFYGPFLLIKIIECYQHYASEERRRRCKCIPSCSEYAILCLKKYELIYALLKIRKRLFVTCQGFDYIIDNP